LSNAEVRGESAFVARDIITFRKLGLERGLKREEWLVGLWVKPHREAFATVVKRAKNGECEYKWLDVGGRVGKSGSRSRELTI
jgi:hypothetical protein